MHKKFTYIVYQIIMAILAVISIGMLIAYYAKRINIDTYPYNMIDNGIWLVFFSDYVIRLIISPDKREFVKDNIFDLLSIIPASSLFFLFSLSLTYIPVSIIRPTLFDISFRTDRLC